jgi:hypothetical protein
MTAFRGIISCRRGTMTKPRTEGQNTSWRISGEAKRLLELMAERMGVSQMRRSEAL